MRFTFLLILFLSVVSAPSQVPADYYDGTENLTGEELKGQLHRILRGHEVRYYAEFRDVILPDLFEDPANEDNIILFYKNASIPKTDFASNNEPDFWNREHTWPKSHGFPNDADTAFTDVHNLTPSDATVNSSKSNKDFNEVAHTTENEEGEAPDTYTNADFWEPRDEVKGDVARILFYMSTRYESAALDLKLVDRKSFSGDPVGVLYTLIRWHASDPVDETERTRHEKAYGYQNNRNPFVDHPEWVADIWGDASSPNISLNQLNFSPDFGMVAYGESLTQQYRVNGYNLESDVEVSVGAPFYLSTDGESFSNTVSLNHTTNETQEEFTVYLRFEPGQSDGRTYTGEVIHQTEGLEPVILTVTGQEGEVQVSTIAEAREQELGASVLISGIVIDAGNNSSNNRIIYDGTAGIVVRSFDAGNESSNLELGDSVLISGGLSEYSGVLQIEESPITIQVITQGVSLPEPQELTIAEIGEEHESELAIIMEVTFDQAGSTFAGGGAAGNFEISDASGTMTFRIGSSSHPLVGTTIPSGVYNLTGFVGEFAGAYQVSARTLDDLVEVEDPGGEPEVLGSDSNFFTSVYPNPTTDEVYVDMGIAEAGHIKIFSQTGQLILYMPAEKRSTVKMNDFAPGMYWMYIKTEQTIEHFKIIKN